MNKELQSAIMFLAAKMREKGSVRTEDKGKIRGQFLLQPEEFTELSMLAVMRGKPLQRLASEMVRKGMEVERKERSDEAAQILWKENFND